MGSYTSIIESECDIVDVEGLKVFLDELKESKRDDYVNREPNWTDTGKNGGPEYANAVKVDWDKKKIDFSPMDGWKIISYWYPQFVRFLRDLAVFIEGDISMSFESDEEAGHITFKDGVCHIRTGVMQYYEDTAQTIRPEIGELPKDLANRLIIRRI